MTTTLCADYYIKKCVHSPDDFNAEDLARTWVTMYAAEISQLVPLHASTKNLSEIFFVGNFFNHPLIREEVTYMMELRKLAPMVSHSDYLIFEIYNNKKTIM